MLQKLFWGKITKGSLKITVTKTWKQIPSKTLSVTLSSASCVSVGIYIYVNLKSSFKKFIGIYTYTHTGAGRGRERMRTKHTWSSWLENYLKPERLEWTQIVLCRTLVQRLWCALSHLRSCWYIPASSHPRESEAEWQMQGMKIQKYCPGKSDSVLKPF